MNISVVICPFFILTFGVYIMSLNSRLKAVEESILKISSLSEEKIKELIAESTKVLHERIEDIASFSGVDDDKTPPAPAPAEPV